MLKQLSGKDQYLIGVISDTHGVVSESAIKVLKGTDLIIHAGDIDTPEAFNTIRAIGPSVIVRGNMDYGNWAQNLRETETVQVGEATLYVCHILTKPDMVPASADIDTVIFGHTHRPLAERQDTILFLNPGSAGQKRHNCPLSVALLCIKGKALDVEFIQI